MKEELFAAIVSLFWGFSIVYGITLANTQLAVAFLLAMFIAGWVFLQIMQLIYLAKLSNQ